MKKTVEIYHEPNRKRTIRAFADRHGNRVIEITEYENRTVEVKQKEQPTGYRILEVCYMVSMSFLGYGVAFYAMTESFFKS